MTTPKLPPLQAPQIPNSMRKGAEQAPPPKSNFFFILMMTFLIIWSFKAFNAPKEDSTVSTEPTVATPIGTAPTLTDETRAALPKEFVAAAEKSKELTSPEFITLGSLDPASPYRMLATLTTRGAAVARVELNESAYADNSDASGYLGQIVVDESLAAAETEIGLPGVAAQAVGAGTPAANAGLKAGDRIVGVVRDGAEKVAINSFDALRSELLATRPGDKIKLEIYRDAALNGNVVYRNLRESVAKSLKQAKTQPSDSAVVESVPETAPNAESVPVASTETASENENVASNADVAEAAKDVETAAPDAPKENSLGLLGESFSTETLEVELQTAPISALRPNGMVADYADYLNLAGLQGAFYGHDDKFDFFEESGIRKKNGDPASFLTTLGSVDGESLTEWALDTEKENAPKRGSAATSLGVGRSPSLDVELAGVDMRDGYWEYVAEKSSENVAVFRKALLERRLEIVKKYELVQESPNADGKKEKNGRGYHLTLTFEVKNVDPNSARSVSYLLDGPTGLPLEGAWFASGRKTGPGWGAYGLRDLVVSMNGSKAFHVVKCWDVASDKTRRSDEIDVDFLGVDGQYFQCSVIPQDPKSDEKTIANAKNRFMYAPIRVGSRLEKRPNFTDVSFRMRSSESKLAPSGQAGDSVSQEFVVFAGPKQPEVLENYGLSKTLVYGWFWFVSIPLLWILHFFHDYLVFNYGLAIVMLTVLVRLCVFPLSRKQVASSIKMQKLQPELTAMKEKYKDNPQEMMQAQQALFRKNGVNPLSGCLPIFIQMPIFIGLYKALSLDVNLYGAPLFTKSVRWCSNLAAPDMAFDWSHFWNSVGWPGFNMSANGFSAMFSLGPYLNILPVITIALFLIQQKLLVPPVVGDDEQARQQRSMRRMMNFMMIFMGFMFFKVPSGLCLYFIVSSLWGLLERKMLPKRDLETGDGATTIDVETVGATASVAGFESKKDKRRAYATTGRTYEVYDKKRDKKGRRISATKEAAPKSKFRAWWDDLVERAKERQQLAKSEYEDGPRKNRNNRRRG